jgi:hypothetical protein
MARTHTHHHHHTASSEAAGKMSSPGFQAKIRSNAKKYEFQAEVSARGVRGEE